MAELILPRSPIYIPSKGRFASCLTALFLDREGVPFSLVVEPQEFDEYANRFGPERVLALPFRDAGSVIPARNWIKQHSIENGHVRHWQLDDNMRGVYRRWKGKRFYCESGVAFVVAEDFVDRYENVAVCGLNYSMFLPDGERFPPFYLNSRVYSCSLILNSVPCQWRGRYNEDTDLCLQVLAHGWCTLLLNVFSIDKLQTMILTGGNTSEIYGGDGRLKMARSLERLWPGVVQTRRRFKRPQHHVDWSAFDTPLKLKEGVNLEQLNPDEYGLRLLQFDPVKSESLKQLLD